MRLIRGCRALLTDGSGTSKQCRSSLGSYSLYCSCSLDAMGWMPPIWMRCHAPWRRMTPTTRRKRSAFRRAQEERERVEHANQVYAGWLREAEEAKQIYPSFDFEAESRNKTFTDLLQSGVAVRTAYEVVHKDDILGGAMQYAAQKAAEKVTNSVQSRAKRPTENGAGAQGASRQVTDVNKLQKDDIYEILRRVEKGEKISF